MARNAVLPLILALSSTATSSDRNTPTGTVRMQKHFQKRIARCRLGAQTTQEILQRLDASYQRFFSHLAKRPPKFRKAAQFGSFVFKQDGFKLNSNILVINKIKKHFKFSYSRPYEGRVKNVRIKRVRPGEYRLYIVTDSTPEPMWIIARPWSG